MSKTQGRFIMWMLAFKKDDAWVTILMPSETDEDVVESTLLKLNKKYDVAYIRKYIIGTEEEKHITKKGEFIGLW